MMSAEELEDAVEKLGGHIVWSSNSIIHERSVIIDEYRKLYEYFYKHQEEQELYDIIHKRLFRT